MSVESPIELFYIAAGQHLPSALIYDFINTIADVEGYSINIKPSEFNRFLNDKFIYIKTSVCRKIYDYVDMYKITNEFVPNNNIYIADAINLILRGIHTDYPHKNSICLLLQRKNVHLLYNPKPLQNAEVNSMAFQLLINIVKNVVTYECYKCIMYFSHIIEQNDIKILVMKLYIKILSW